MLIAQADALRDGKLLSSELTARAIERFDATRGTINAALSLDRDMIVRAQRLGASERSSPLFGMPLAHKDMFNRVGHRASFGSRLPQASAPAATALVIERLERAGALTIGALNMAEFALGPTGHNAVFGDCRNPWDTARISGGSSSGPAAAVAVGIVAASIGSDTGGSIRIPASCCGVTGLKPTAGLIDATGAMPLAPSLDCIGPIAQTAEDCALVMALIAPDMARMERPAAPRLAFARQAVAHFAAGEIGDALEEAVRRFERAGGVLRDVVLPDIDPLHDLADLIQRSEAASVHLGGLALDRLRYTTHVRRRIEAGLFVAAPAYALALRQRPLHVRRFVEQVLDEADALLLPTIGQPVPTLEATDETRCASAALLRDLSWWTRWLNYLGVPALSVPCGVDRNGMPIGMQIVGRPGSDCLLLAIGRWFQQLGDWHLRRPVLSEGVPAREG